MLGTIKQLLQQIAKQIEGKIWGLLDRANPGK